MTWKMTPVFMLLALASVPVTASTTTTGCASLCGDWQLDVSASDAPERALDAAFVAFKEPKPRRMRDAFTDNVGAMGEAADEAALGPIIDRPHRQELRAELQAALRQPRLLAISATARDLRIASDGQLPLTLTPGEPHARVDRYGTARIEVRWRGPLLSVSESYDRRNQQQTTYALRSADNALLVQQVITRPGLPKVTVRSIYRRR